MSDIEMAQERERERERDIRAVSRKVARLVATEAAVVVGVRRARAPRPLNIHPVIDEQRIE